MAQQGASPLPATWEFQTPIVNTGVGLDGRVTIPAPIAPVRNVITTIHAVFLNVRGDAANVNLFMQVIDSVVGTVRQIPVTTNCPAGSYDVWSFDRDLLYLGSPGATLTVTFSAGAVNNCFESIIVEGYSL